MGRSAGSAGAGGYNFQAAATALAYAHVLAKRPLNWLPGMAPVPRMVEAETGGAGDDIRISCADVTRIEVQVKRGLTRGQRLWDAVGALASGLEQDASLYGVLLVDGTSSNPVKHDLRWDVARVAHGRRDGLRDIARELIERLEERGIHDLSMLRRFAIVERDLYPGSSGHENALALIAGVADDPIRAWEVLELDAHALIEGRGARDGEALRRRLTNAGLTVPRQVPTPVAGPALEEAWLVSRSRCANRWVRLGVERDRAFGLADDPTVGAPSSGLEQNLEATRQANPVTVIAAAAGSGKSLLLERLYQRGLRHLGESLSAPAPVYLEARAVGDSLREAVATEGSALGAGDGRGLMLFLDGADEAGPARALELLEEARVLADSVPQGASVVVSSRPLPDLGSRNETLELPPLSDEEAQRLVNLFGGAHAAFSFGRGWPDSLENAVRRPLFAILYGLYRRESEEQRWTTGPRSTGELLASLAERATQRTGEHAETEELLARLAMASTERGGGFVERAEVAASPHELETLAQGGLVTQRGDAVAFSLPILAEWFAARALRSGMVDSADLASSPRRLELWRYPLAIAAGTFGHEEVARIMDPLARRAPAFASQVIEDGLSRWGRSEAAPPPAEEFVRRIRASMQSWVDGIGPLADLIAPVKSSDSGRTVCPLGFVTAPGGLGEPPGIATDVAWYRGKEDLPEVVPVSREELRGGDPFREARDWPLVRSMVGPGRQPAWAWRFTLDELVRALSKLLNKRALPLDTGLLVTREEAWRTARTAARVLLRTPIGFNAPLALPDVDLALTILGPEDETYMDRFGDGRSDRYDIRSLRGEVERLQETGATEMAAPWPTEDRLPGHPAIDPLGSGSAYFWEFYSPERLLERSRTVLAGVLEAYQWFVERYFPSFRLMLTTAATLPARVEGVLVPPRLTEDAYEQPVLIWHLRPLPRGSNNEVEVGFGDAPPDQTTILSVLEDLRSLRPQIPGRVGVATHYTLDALLAPTPVSEIAYKLLWDDLKRLSWVQRTLDRRTR